MENNKFIIRAELNNDAPVKTPKVNGLAYAGGLLDLGWELPVDLQGLTIPETIPLLANHENKTDSRVGIISAEVVNNQLLVSGEILSQTEEAKDIVAQGKKATWQMSIGAEVIEVQKIEAGTMTVNAQELEAPFFYVSKAILREVSVVAVGADINSKMTIEAKSQNLNNSNLGVKTNMTDEVKEEIKEEVKAEEKVVEEVKEVGEEKEEVKEEVKAEELDVQKALEQERKRIADIKKIIDGEDVDLENEAIQAGWTADLTASKMLSKIRANRPNVNIVVKENNMDNNKVIEAALSIRAGIDEEKLVKSLGEQAVEAGYKARNYSLKDCATELLKAEGKTIHGFGNAEIKAAFASTNLTGILSNVANKRLAQSFMTYEPVALKVAQEADINDFKPSEIYSIADSTNLPEVDYSTAKLADGSLAEAKGVNELKTYGEILRITRKDLINDDLGAFTRLVDLLGKRCARTIDQLFFKKVLANGNYTDNKAFFSDDHNNLMQGSDTALSIEAVKNAITKFITQIGVDGEPVGIMPKYLMVPSELYMLAKEICESQYVVSGANTRVPQLNAVAGLLEVVQSPYLSNSTYTGNSKTAWYVLGGKDELPAFEVGFLKGQRVPQIESGTVSFDELSVGFKVYFDLGIGLIDPRGAVKATGVAEVTESSSSSN